MTDYGPQKFIDELFLRRILLTLDGIGYPIGNIKTIQGELTREEPPFMGRYMSSGNHIKQNRQSLMLHIEAVKLLDADPALADQALATLKRWDEHVSPRSKPLRDQWERIIKNRDWTLALEESERGNQLRQASPLTTLLPQALRLEIIRSLRTKSIH